MAINYREEKTLRARLTARYYPSARAGADDRAAHELVQTVASAADPECFYRPSYWPTPDSQDFLDALGLVAAAREALEYAELQLLDAGRRGGLTWEALGEALGYAPAAARQGASGRARRLLERWPGSRAGTGGTVLRQGEAAAASPPPTTENLTEDLTAETNNWFDS